MTSFAIHSFSFQFTIINTDFLLMLDTIALFEVNGVTAHYDRQTGRQTDRQTDTDTDRQTRRVEKTNRD